jgi:N-acetylglutamate synthase-like GNAT family acetyltransferase
MAYTFKSPESDQEWQDYYELRWRILREPWQQPRGSERDEHECDAFHVMVLDDMQRTVATGRLHRIDDSRAQIRYMAVTPGKQGSGIGSKVLQILEETAKAMGFQEIILNARETSLGFYRRYGYQILADAPVLFGSIAHKRMRKSL